MSSGFFYFLHTIGLFLTYVKSKKQEQKEKKEKKELKEKENMKNACPLPNDILRDIFSFIKDKYYYFASHEKIIPVYRLNHFLNKKRIQYEASILLFQLRAEQHQPTGSVNLSRLFTSLLFTFEPRIPNLNPRITFF